MTVSKVKKALPVVGGDIMFAAADVIADGVHDRGVQRRHGGCWQAGLPKERVDRTGMVGGQELAPWISPQIFFGAGDVERTRRDQRKKHVLIKRQIGFALIVLLKISAKPMGKAGVDGAHGFAKAAPGECRSATTGIIRDDQRKAFIAGARPQRGFAQA